MMNKIFESSQSRLLKQALDIYQKQHDAISKNVANSNSEGYQRVNTDFTHELNVAKASRMKTSESKHISRNAPRGSFVHEKNGENSNNVDIAHEMTLLAENQIRYEFAARLLNRLYRGITTSITGRIR